MILTSGTEGICKMTTLSHDARSLFTAIFGLGATELCFGFMDSQPTARCNAALAELELAGIVTRAVDRDRRRIVYRAAVGLSEKTLRGLRVPQSKLASIQIAEPRAAEVRP